MMIIEPPITVRFPTGATARSAAGIPQNRSMWNSMEDVNGAGYVASCRLACSCGFDMPWVRSKKYTGPSFTRRNKLVKNRFRASSEHPGSAQDPVKKIEKPSYHPSEEIVASTSENCGDARLTAAETSRTIIEVFLFKCFMCTTERKKKKLTGCIMMGRDYCMLLNLQYSYMKNN